MSLSHKLPLSLFRCSLLLLRHMAASLAAEPQAFQGKTSRRQREALLHANPGSLSAEGQRSGNIQGALFFTPPPLSSISSKVSIVACFEGAQLVAGDLSLCQRPSLFMPYRPRHRWSGGAVRGRVLAGLGPLSVSAPSLMSNSRLNASASYRLLSTWFRSLSRAASPGGGSLVRARGWVGLVVLEGGGTGGVRVVSERLWRCVWYRRSGVATLERGCATELSRWWRLVSSSADGGVCSGRRWWSVSSWSDYPVERAGRTRGSRSRIVHCRSFYLCAGVCCGSWRRPTRSDCPNAWAALPR